VTAAQLRSAAQAVDEAMLARNALIAAALAQGWTQRAVAQAVGLSAGRLGQLAQELGRVERKWVPND
jgi:putative AlgH/UPF0301 family transcriptional regulator